MKSHILTIVALPQCKLDAVPSLANAIELPAEHGYQVDM